MALDFYAQQSKNVKKTILLVSIMLFLVFLAGLALDFIFGTIFLVTGILLIITLIQLAISLGSGYKIVLSSVDAKKLEESTKDDEEKQLLNIVDELSISAGMARPEVYVMNDESINAFATGSKPEKSFVCVTTGLLKNLNREETEGVIAHEMSHIKNKDILLMTMISALVGGVLLLSIITFRAGLVLLRGSVFLGGGKKSSKDNSGSAILAITVGMLFVAGVMFLIGQISKLMNLAISRKREFLADATAVQLTRNPQGLSGALRKIYNLPLQTKSANSATAPLFISEPKNIKLSEKRGFLANLLSTHPPLIDRIAVLEAKDPEFLRLELERK